MAVVRSIAKLERSGLKCVYLLFLSQRTGKVTAKCVQENVH